MTAEPVEVGRIVKPHGIRGEVVVALATDRVERFAAGATLHAGDRDLTIVASRPHQGRMLVAFEGVADRTAAERLRGRVLTADRGADEDPGATYLASELVGMAVVGEDGRGLGTVEALVELPPAAAYDLLEVRRDDGTTWYLPAVEEYVAVEQDEEGRERLVLESPPAGLVDDDEAEPDRPAS